MAFGTNTSALNTCSWACCERRSVAAKLLHSEGVFLDDVRERIADWRKRFVEPKAIKGVAQIHGESSEITDVVEIHDESWDVRYVRREAAALTRFVWQQREWRPMDILVEKATGHVFFDLALRDDDRYEFVAGGWPRVQCAICRWELNADKGPEHSTGYTNGRDWVCVECYKKFILSKASPSEPPGEL